MGPIWQKITHRKSIWPWIIPLVGILTLGAALSYQSSHQVAEVEPEKAAAQITEQNHPEYPDGNHYGYNDLEEPLDVVWRGTIKALLVYGRYRIEIPSTYDAYEKYPEFIVEFSDKNPKELKVGDFVEVKGQLEAYDCYELCTPWVLANSIVADTTQTETTETDIQGYTIKFTRTFSQIDPEFNITSRIYIIKNKQIVFETEEVHEFGGFYVGKVGDWIRVASDIKRKALKDVNGDGKPELFLSGWTGGAHCCSDDYIIQLSNPLTVFFHVNTGDYGIELKDLNYDGVMEIETNDPIFAYWHTSGLASPAPRVVLSLKNGKYQADPIFMRKPAPSDQEISKNAKAIENWSSQAGPEVPWKYALDLIYSGNVVAAKKYIDLGWRDYEYNEWKTKEDFLSELQAQIIQSAYSIDLQSYFNLGSLSSR